MAKIREVYRCSSCGAQTTQWRGQCPSCHEWNTLEAVTQPKTAVRTPHRTGVVGAGGRAVPLHAVADEGHEPFGSGLAPLDRILGKGLVPGAALLMGGEPGIGKSTLLLQVAGMVAAGGRTALYASGEESLPQIRGRAERLGLLDSRLLALATSRVEDVLEAATAAAPALLIVDSVQTLTSLEARQSRLPPRE